MPRVPQEVVTQKCQRHMRNDAPIHRRELLTDSDVAIMSRYQAEYWSVVQYYLSILLLIVSPTPSITSSL